jgi:PAS domain S-box-containing protein
MAEPPTDPPTDAPTREYLELALLGLQSLPDAWLVFFDRDLRYRLAAGGGLSLAGFEAGAIEGRLLSEVLPHERARFWEPLYRRALEGESLQFELAGINGERWYEIRLAPWDVDGVRVGGFSSGREITHRKRIERANARLAAVVASSDDAVISKTLTGEITTWNPGAERMYGYLAAEAIGQNIAILVPEDRRAELAAVLDEAAAGRSVRNLATIRRRRNGTDVEVSVTVSPILDEAGTVIGASAVGRDVTEQGRRERERERELSDLENAQRLARLGSWHRDHKTGEVTWSRQMYEVFGRDPALGPASGQALLGYVHPADRERVLAAVGGPDATREFELEFRIRTDAGGERTVHVRGGPDPAQPGVFGGSCQDVTEARRAEQARAELVASATRAEDANRAKSEFLARMSHELRTPLNAILGFAQLLKLESPTASQLESIEYILKGGGHLLELINEVLDIARIETGRLGISLEPVPVADVIRDAVALATPLLRERELTLDLELDRLPPGCHVMADRNRLQQVLLNLLSNAVKYNRPGGQVIVSCAEEREGRVAISIADTGIGIDDHNLERLFQPFDRLGAERTAIEGTGLGLALSKGLVEAMGGTISVSSKPGVGTTLELEFGLAPEPGADETLAPADEEPDEPGLERAPRARILYIEDNLSNLTLVKRILGRYGDVELIPAMQGSIGLELARELRPDLVVLDLHLPDISGAEVLRRLRDADLQTPVIVVTADATKGQAEQLRRLGASEYVTKPLDIGRFLDAISAQLGGRGVRASRSDRG